MISASSAKDAPEMILSTERRSSEFRVVIIVCDVFRSGSQLSDQGLLQIRFECSQIQGATCRKRLHPLLGEGCKDVHFSRGQSCLRELTETQINEGDDRFHAHNL